MRESGSPEILAPRETDCGEDWECRAAQISAKAMSASKFWTSDDRAPRGHRERHAKKEWSAKARNHPRVASALPHSEGIAYKPLYIVCEDGKAIGRMYEDRQTLPELRWFWSITVYVDPKRGINTSGRAASLDESGASAIDAGFGLILLGLLRVAVLYAAAICP